IVHDPGFFTVTAALVRMAWSRSVAVMLSRSPSASMRKLDRMGMVVLRSTTLCVAVSSFTSSWRLTVISIADPCTDGFSTSVSTIGIVSPSAREADSWLGLTLQHIVAWAEGSVSSSALIVFTFCFAVWVEKRDTFLNSGGGGVVCEWLDPRRAHAEGFECWIRSWRLYSLEG